MNKEIISFAKSTQLSGNTIGESFKNVKKTMANHLKNRIDLLETALKYTNKTVLKKRHKKELPYLKASLNSLQFDDKLGDYLDSVEEFAKTGVN